MACPHTTHQSNPASSCCRCAHVPGLPPGAVHGPVLRQRERPGQGGARCPSTTAAGSATSSPSPLHWPRRSPRVRTRAQAWHTQTDDVPSSEPHLSTGASWWAQGPSAGLGSRLRRSLFLGPSWEGSGGARQAQSLSVSRACAHLVSAQQHSQPCGTECVPGSSLKVTGRSQEELALMLWTRWLQSPGSLPQPWSSSVFGV